MGGKTSTTNQSSTQSIPPEVLARYNAVNSRAESAAAAPFTPYSPDPNAFVAPLTQTQTAGINNINSATSIPGPYFGAATGATLAGAGQVNPDQITGQSVNQYLSPYLGTVLGTTAALQNQANAQQAQQLKSQAIQGGAFGGDRAGIAQANLAQQQGLASGKVYSDILNQGYGQALGTAVQQQGVGLGAQQANLARLSGAGQQLAGLGAGFVHGFHHKQKAVTPVHEGLAVDVFVVLHEVQPAFEPLVHHAAIVATRQTELGFGGGAQQRTAKFV
jgi:hypothetical protein